MRTITLFVCILIPYFLFSQTQLQLDGATISNEPVAKINVNYPSVVGDHTYGLEIDYGLSNSTDGLLMYGNGTGIRVEARGTGYGGRFKSNNAVGIYGNSHSENLGGYGVYGHNSRSGLGSGVYGWAQGGGENFGVKGRSSSPTGTGVYGFIDATQPIGESYGVHGKANTATGAGVFGENNMGPAVLGLAMDIGVGVKGQGSRGAGGMFYSEYNYGIATSSGTEYGIRAEGENTAGGYFIGGIDVNGIETDLVLGVEGTNETLDNGVISTDLSSASSDFHIWSNDQVIIKLDNDDDEDSFMQVVNGGDEKIFTLLENGDLEIKGVLTHTSDINSKYDLQEVDYDIILSKLGQVKIYDWKYIGQFKSHMGPMAQDFFKAFRLNDSDKKIASLDIDGVALASIKALQYKIDKQDSEIENLKRLVNSLLKVGKYD